MDLPAEKGKDSVRNGIQLVQSQQMSVTKRSVNIIKEYRNFLWMTDKQGKILNEPETQFKHLMDAISYALTSVLRLANNTATQKRQMETFDIRKNRQTYNSTK
jgi:phage terminase large subunit